MSTDNTYPPETEDGTVEPDRQQSCPRCKSPVQRTTQLGTRNRSTVLFCCPDCGFGAVAVTHQTGALSEMVKQRLQDRREAIVHGLSAYRLAAFVSEGCPRGEYRVERLSEHRYRISVPEHTTQSQLGPLADRIAAAADHLLVQTHSAVPALTVQDARFDDADAGSSDAQTDGGYAIALPSAGGPQQLPPVFNDDDDRTKRAKREDMNVSLLRKGGIYEVDSESGNTYEVDILEDICSCPDNHDRCKHRRRVEMEIDCHRVPRPDGRLPTGE